MSDQPTPRSEASVSPHPHMDDLERTLTAAVREADQTFERVGGSSRHWVRDCFLPALAAHQLAVVALSASPQQVAPSQSAVCEFLGKTCAKAWPQDPASWCAACQQEHWFDSQDDDDPRTVEEIAEAGSLPSAPATGEPEP